MSSGDGDEEDDDTLPVKIWYRDKRQLSIGGVCRYTITFTRRDPRRQNLFVKLKNIEKVGIRAVHLLSGPFIVYCHVVPHAYSAARKFVPIDCEENTEVVFDHQVKPGQTFDATLCMNDNSLVTTDDDGNGIFLWEIDVISQIFVTSRTTVLYDMLIGTDVSQMSALHRSSLFDALPSLYKPKSLPQHPSYDSESFRAKSHSSGFSVKVASEKDLWNKDPPRTSEPAHLVILSHGIFSNLTADMLYMKDAIENLSTQNILVRGYSGNAGLTEKGIKRMAIGVAHYLIRFLEENQRDKTFNITKVSFVGHLLGGVVQLYAIKYILLVKGENYFDTLNIRPWNFVSLASPFLGILNDMSYLISVFLDLGTLGRTGRDLTLLREIPTFKDLFRKREKEYSSLVEAKRSGWWKPLLEQLPNDPLQSFLAEFESLTLYANAVNDGIVPLRTGALLYLDWEALGDVSLLEENNATLDATGRPKHTAPLKNITRQLLPLHADTDLTSTNLRRDSAGMRNVDEIPLRTSKSIERKALGNRARVKSLKRLLCLNFCAPDSELKPVHHRQQRQKKTSLTRKEKRIKSISATASRAFEPRTGTGAGSNATLEPNSIENGASDKSNGPIIIPPKASPIESAISTLLCPVPPQDFILDPACRLDVIFHDRFYSFENLPSGEYTKSRNFLVHLYRFFVYHYEWKLYKQAKIARKYQGPNLTWRKVLVNLPPDAHNNIIVRRRFSNGYGWGVVDHLCESLFSGGDHARHVSIDTGNTSAE